MGNIFIDRHKELKLIKTLTNKKFFLVVTGRRRIGKTVLLKKAFPDANYIFIWPNKSVDWILKEVSNEINIPEFRNFKDLINYLLDQGKVVIIDEFQNILNVDKSIYGEIQKVIDERKFNDKNLNLAVAGSSYSLMNRIFNDVASPLYGRRTNEIKLSHLPIKDLFNWLNVGIENFIELWSVFEGVPYYFELIDKRLSARENIKNLLISKNAQLQGEGRVILSVEFGEHSKTYNTILSAISEGKTKLSEIASLFDNKPNYVIKYLDILRKQFGLVTRITPVTEDPKRTKSGIYRVNDNFLNFWFYFVEHNMSYIEQGRFFDLEKFFDDNFNSFVGRIFEKFIIFLVAEGVIFSKYNKVGKQFGKSNKIFDNKNTYEIDIIALSEKTKEILFCECKWKSKVNTLKVIKKLEEKTKYVKWNNENRKESYAVFAKSFNKKIKEFNGKRVYCYDLKDIENLLKKT